MNATTLLFKKILIGGLVVLISIMHFSVSGENPTMHALHRELYFVPILLAAFWFGFRSGFFVSLGIGILYSSYILITSHSQPGAITAVPQVFVYVLVGTMLGWLADKRKELHEKEINDSNIVILGRASSAVAHEMKGILEALKSMFARGKGLHDKELDRDFETELDRLSKMADILSSYAKKEKGRIFSHDLNSILKERIANFQNTAIEQGIIFEMQLDPDGCPSWIDPNQIGWILDKLIENAMEVSSTGNTIHIRSKRGGEFCTLSVKDEGPGVKPEHLKKIFSPFFTTKADGQGLALAGCRKSLHDMGGEISVQSTLGEGAEFTIQVPREHRGKPLAENMAKAVFAGHSDEQLYRE